MSGNHAQEYPPAPHPHPQRKPTGASDRLQAGAQYGLRPADTGVSDEPTSFATGRLERLTVSPQSTLSASSSSSLYTAYEAGVPPSLPPKIPAGTSPQYTTSRTGSVSVAPPSQPRSQKHRVLAPMPVQRPPSPPRQRRVPPPLGGLGYDSLPSSRASSPLTPPLTPSSDRHSPQPHQRTQFPVPQPHSHSSSGSRPLPQVPRVPQQEQTHTPPTVSPQSSLGMPSPGSPAQSQPPPTPQAAVQPRRAVESPLRAAHTDAHAAHIGALPRGPHQRAATMDSQPQQNVAHARAPQSTAQPIRAATEEAQRTGRSQVSQPRSNEPLRSASFAVEGTQPRHTTAQPATAPQRAAPTEERPGPTHPPPRAATVGAEGGQPAPPRVAATDVKRPSAVDTEAAQALGPAVPPKSAGPPVPEKQATTASAPAKVSAAASASSPQPPKPSTPAASNSLPTAASAAPKRNRPKAQPKDKVKVEGKESITHTSYLDPCLQKSLLTVPASMTTTADAALSAVEAYPEQDFNWTIGAPIGGLGGLAKHYVLRPDAKFQTENGGISLTLAVVDERGGGVPSPAPTPGPDGNTPPKVKQGRTKARVEVRSDRGGILIDLRELDANRQIDLLVETRKGDVLLLLPESFLGPVHVRGEEPVFGSILRPQLDDVVNPYEGLWTTNVVPLGAERGAGRKNKFRAHKFMKGISKYVPEALREQDDYLDMAVSSYTTLKKGDQSKVLIRAEKGKVCVGMGGTKDAKDLREKEDIKVGAADGTKKHWWS